MNDSWRDRLSEYVDGELESGERGALESHLRECPACAEALEDLRRVVARAEALRDRSPTRDLWPGVAERIRPQSGVVDVRDWRARTGRKITLSVPQLAAAGLALVAVSAGAVWLLLAPGPAATGPRAAAGPGTDVPAIAAAVVTPDYDAAVTALEQVLAAQRAQLDPETVRVLEENLAVIDRALADARAALAQDPANTYVSAHLAATMRRKVDFLRRATTIVGAAM
jgi:anti-sigma factor RsiW